MLTGIKNEYQFITFFSSAENCRKYLFLKRWPSGKPWCHHCSHTKVYQFSDRYRFKCARCQRIFTLTTGTIFNRSKIPFSLWYKGIYEYVQHTNGYPATALANRLGISYKTAWYMHHRIMQLFEMVTMPSSGTHEIDGIGIGPDENKMNQKTKSKKKTTVAGHRHRLTVIARLTRGDSLVATVMRPYPTSTEVNRFAKQTMDPASTVYCDNGKEFARLNERVITVKKFVHAIGQYGKGSEHSNTIENAFSKFRRYIKTYVRLRENYLEKYCNEFCFLYTYKTIHKKTDVECFDIAMSNINRSMSLESLKNLGHQEKERLKN